MMRKRRTEKQSRRYTRRTNERVSERCPRIFDLARSPRSPALTHALELLIYAASMEFHECEM